MLQRISNLTKIFYQIHRSSNKPEIAFKNILAVSERRGKVYQSNLNVVSCRPCLGGSNEGAVSQKIVRNGISPNFPKPTPCRTIQEDTVCLVIRVVQESREKVQLEMKIMLKYRAQGKTDAEISRPEWKLYALLLSLASLRYLFLFYVYISSPSRQLCKDKTLASGTKSKGSRVVLLLVIWQREGGRIGNPKDRALGNEKPQCQPGTWQSQELFMSHRT